MDRILIERIQGRMAELGANASAVALAAGLGRSAVRDILTRKAQHPRIDTIRKIAEALNCTVDYLTGEASDPTGRSSGAEYWQYDAQLAGVQAIVEAGVYRQQVDRDEVVHGPEIHLKYRDRRLPEWHVSLFQMGDNSLGRLNIVKGDVLTVAMDFDDMRIDLTKGLLVLVRHRLDQPKLEEISIRQVEIHVDQIRLVCRGDVDIPAIVIAASEMEKERALAANYYSAISPSSAVSIEGIVTRVSREVPIGEEG